MLMGVAFGLQWPVSLYGGAVLGLQRQVLWNSVSAAASITRGLGAFLTISLISPTVEAFFVWQAIMSLLNSLASRWLWGVHCLRLGRFRGFGGGFSKRICASRSTLRAHLILATVTTQLDKVLLTTLLPLAEFGYYSLATTASSALYSVIGPVAVATQPRLAQLVTTGDTDAVRTLYHRSCQVMSVIVLPPAIVAAVFAPELLTAWTGNPETVVHTRALLPVLVAGTALNGLVNVPYGLQLAYRWSRFGLVQNAIAAIVLAPMILGLVLSLWNHGRGRKLADTECWVRTDFDAHYASTPAAGSARDLVLGGCWATAHCRSGRCCWRTAVHTERTDSARSRSHSLISLRSRSAHAPWPRRWPTEPGRALGVAARQRLPRLFGSA